MDLAEFLLARIAEDEAVARASAREGGTWATSAEFGSGAVEAVDSDPHDVGIVVYDEGRPNEDQAAHIARHDPARVLAECEARREIVELVQGPLTEVTWTAVGCSETTDPGDTQVGDKILRVLALPFADHSDYQPEWKP